MKTFKTFPETDCPRANVLVVEPFCLGDFFIMEQWKDILGYEGLYQVSNLGRVKSMAKSWLNNTRYKPETIHVPYITQTGYLAIGLRKNGISVGRKVHRLVYEAFNGEIPKGMQIDHIDNCKLNNKISNLQLLTPRQNTTKHYLNSNKSSSYIGVRERNCKWDARIVINKKSIHLGTFSTELEAAKAYQDKLNTIK